MKQFLIAASLSILFIIAAGSLTGCSTIEYYFDDPKLQSLQDRVEAKADQLEAEWDAKTALERAELKEKMGKIQSKIDKYRESNNYIIYEQILKLIDEL